MARAAEELGFDAFFRSDHYLKIGPASGLPGPTDSWITLAGLARETARIRLGTLVSAATFRYPGPAGDLGRPGGRDERAAGSSWASGPAGSTREHSAYGIPFPGLAERFARLEEQLAIITGLWEHRRRARRSPSTASTTRSTTRPRCPSRCSARARRSWSAGTGRAAPRGWRRGTPTSSTSCSLSPEETAAAFGRVRDGLRGGRPGPGVAGVLGRADGVLRPDPRGGGAPGGGDRPDVADAARRPGWPGSPARDRGQAGPVRGIGATRMYLQVLDLHDLDHLELIAGEVMPRVR